MRIANYSLSVTASTIRSQLLAIGVTALMLSGCKSGASSPPPSPPPAATSIAISITAPSKAEGSTFAFTLTRTGNLTASSSVAYAVSGTANGADFTGGTAPSGTISFAANSESATLLIGTANDKTVEPNESFTVTLSSPSNATIGQSTASATITNNDGTGTAAPVTIVVLGESTSAGKNIWQLFPGTTPADEPAYAKLYGWVSLYGNALDAINPSNSVINISLSGYSTTRALNDTTANASYQNSLAFAIKQHSNADAFIFSFPGVRGPEGETPAKVISNLIEMQNRALTAGVRQVWITTSQPSKNKTDCFVINASGACHPTLTLYQTRVDLTNRILASFPFTIDLYRPLARNRAFDQTLDPALLNSVDLVHPNVNGHIALKDAVVAAKLYEGLQ